MPAEADLTSGLTFEYYTGTFEELPQFDDLSPVDTGVVPSPCLKSLHDVGILRNRHTTGELQSLRLPRLAMRLADEMPARAMS